MIVSRQAFGVIALVVPAACLGVVSWPVSGPSVPFAQARAGAIRSAVVASSPEQPQQPRQDEDWRSFRARLVAQETQNQTNAGEEVDASEAVPAASVSPEGWVHETPLIEQGCVILSSTQQRYGFGLHQQYFHKCVMLVLSHTADFTRGIILNRPTPFKNDDGWSLWFGGDVQSFQDDRTAREVTCLHTLESPAAQRMSVKVIEGIYYTTYDCAKELVDQGSATPADFSAFVGYAGWGPGQLQDELDRTSGSSWRLASAATGVLLREFQEQQREGDEVDGIATWESLMRRLGHGPAEVESSAGGFSDRMLKEWIRVNLRPATPTPVVTAAAVAAAAEASKGSRSPVALDEGSVLRAAAVVSAFTLGRQYLHKSIILLLRAGALGSVGLVLNRPSDKRVALPGGGAMRNILFGGSLTLRDESIVWLHRNPAVPGEPMGGSDVFKASAEQAVTAIQRGDAREADFIPVKGVLAWGAGSLEREVAAGHFVPVAEVGSVPWESIWHLADPAATDALSPGLEGVGCAEWNKLRQAEPAAVLGGDEAESADGDEGLADVALLKWVDTFLS